jgi:hypothetical protein
MSDDFPDGIFLLVYVQFSMDGIRDEAAISAIQFPAA